jgi:ABC-type spermidine/putrescine transport system permease subunit II
VSRGSKGTGEALRDFPTFRLVSGIVFAFLYLPLLFVVGYSFNDNRIVTVWKGFTFHWYADVLANHDIQRALMNSRRAWRSACSPCGGEGAHSPGPSSVRR